MLYSLTLFIKLLKKFRRKENVILVAPDAGAAKHITLLGQALDLKCAIASKHRPKPEEAIIEEIIGDFKNKTTAIIIDDMISSGDTIYEVVKKLIEKKGIDKIYLGISHTLCIPVAKLKLEEMHKIHHLQKVYITNSIPQTEAFHNLNFIQEICLSEILARTIN